MDLTGLKEKIRSLAGKYKYAALIMMVGLVLMLIPSGKDHQPAEQSTEPAEIAQTDEERLEQILMQIEGAGKVRVMLTQAAGAETVYQTDEDSSQGGESSSQRRDTVTITDGSRVQTGLVRQVNPPVYLGAVIVCQGADSPAVKLAVTDAVAKVTNLGANQITVLKMK